MSSAFIHRTLFNTKEDADVTFIIENRELRAHQFILCSRSPVFKAMIKGAFAPADQRHVIADPNIKYEDFENFLKYLYVDELCMEDLEPEDVVKLLHLSNMYDVDLLFYDCVMNIIENLGENNILKYAELGILYNDRCGLLTKCLNHLFDYLPIDDVEETDSDLDHGSQKDFPLFSYDLDEGSKEVSKEGPIVAAAAPGSKVDSKAKEVAALESVLISPELALEIVKRCQRTKDVTEEVIFNHIFEWIEAKCKEEKLPLNIENVNKFFAPLWYHFDYNELSPDTLYDYVYTYEMIPEKQLLKIYHNNFNIVKTDIDNLVNNYGDEDDDDDDDNQSLGDFSVSSW